MLKRRDFMSHMTCILSLGLAGSAAKAQRQMKKFLLWVRINAYQTINTIVYAESAYDAKKIGEAQYGVGNVLNYTEVND